MSIDDKVNPNPNYNYDPSNDISNDRNFLQSANKVDPNFLAMKTNKFAMAMDLASPVLSTGLGAMPMFSGKSMVTTAITGALGGTQALGFGSPMGGSGGMYGAQASMMGSPSGAGGSGGRLFMTGPGGGSNQNQRLAMNGPSGGLGALPPPPPPPPPMGGMGGGMGGPPGGGGMGMGGGGMAGMGGPDQFQGQIDNMFNNNMMFLMIQTKVQNMSQQMQTVSNIMKADADSRLNAVRNFRS